jgi:flagellar basal-body rod protein FlgG
VTPRGFEVLGQGGPITVPPGSLIDVDPSGRILADGQVLDTLELVDVDDKLALQKIGNNLYQIDPQSQAQEVAPTDLEVQQGYLEAGNVEVVTEMVGMIEVQRAFEMYTKMMRGTADMDEKLTQQVGRANV